MSSLRKQTFPFHLNKDFSVAKIDYQKQEIPEYIHFRNLDTYLFLLLDKSCNLHFLQYRELRPDEPLINPPSIAQIGHGRIKFILPYSRLRSFLLKRPIEEKDLRFYSKENPIDELEALSLGDNRLLVKLHKEDPVFIFHFDQRFDTKTVIILDSLKDARFITSCGPSKIIFFQADRQAVIYCLSTGQSQVLNFTRVKDFFSMRYLGSKGVVLGTYSNQVETLDSNTNTVLETIFFPDCEWDSLEVDPFNSNRFAIIFETGHPSDSRKLAIKIWRVNDDLTLHSFKECELEIPKKSLSLKFIRKDQIGVLDGNNQLSIFHISEKKNEISLVSKIELAEHDKEITKPARNRLFFLDNQYFLVWVELKIYGCNTNKLILFRQQDQTFRKESLCSKEQSEKKIHSQDLFMQEIETFFEDQPDPVGGITHWENKYILFMTMSQRLLHYDLQTGKLRQIFSFHGIISHHFTLCSITCIDKDHFVLVFRNEEKAIRTLIFDLMLRNIIFDSQKQLKDEIIALAVMEIKYGKVILCFQTGNLYEYIIQEFDCSTLQVRDITIVPNILSLNFLNQDKLIVFTDGFRMQEVSLISSEKTDPIQLEIDKILQDLEVKGRLIDYDCLSNGIIALSFEVSMSKSDSEEEENNADFDSEKEAKPSSLLVFWDMKQEKIVSTQKLELRINRFVGFLGKFLLYSFGEKNELVFVPFERKRALMNHVNQDEQELNERMKFSELYKSHLNVRRQNFETLDNDRMIACFYDGDIFPNSLMFLRRRSVKLECLNVIHGCLKDKYNKYVILDVMQMIFGPLKVKTNEKSEGLPH